MAIKVSDQNVPNYFNDTDPLEFIKDLKDILADGDCLTPENLVKDIRQMIDDYLKAHETEEAS